MATLLSNLAQAAIMAVALALAFAAWEAVRRVLQGLRPGACTGCGARHGVRDYGPAAGRLCNHCWRAVSKEAS